MLAALENVPNDHVEAAQVDGASSPQIFREIIWPQVLPVAVTYLITNDRGVQDRRSCPTL